MLASDLTDPARGWIPITLTDTPAKLPAGTRSIRFNVSGGGAGTVKCDFYGKPANDDAAVTSTGITRDVSNGEVWSVLNTAVKGIYLTGTTATVDALL